MSEQIPTKKEVQTEVFALREAIEKAQGLRPCLSHVYHLYSTARGYKSWHHLSARIKSARGEK